jgi:VanZ family protein
LLVLSATLNVSGLTSIERGPLKHARELFWHYWLPVLVMLTLINFESTDAMSGMHTGEHLQRLFMLIGLHLSSHQLDAVNLVLRKCGHALGYGALCFCRMLLLRGSYWLQHDYSRFLKTGVQVRRMWWRPEWALLAVLFTFLVAASDELHQMSIPSRTGTWHDVALDTTAAVVSVMLVWAKAAWTCQTGQQVTSEQ